jgi:hypothetical protein
LIGAERLRPRSHLMCTRVRLSRWTWVETIASAPSRAPFCRGGTQYRLELRERHPGRVRDLNRPIDGSRFRSIHTKNP